MCQPIGPLKGCILRQQTKVLYATALAGIVSIILSQTLLGGITSSAITLASIGATITVASAIKIILNNRLATKLKQKAISELIKDEWSLGLSVEFGSRDYFDNNPSCNEHYRYFKKNLSLCSEGIKRKYAAIDKQKPRNLREWTNLISAIIEVEMHLNKRNKNFNLDIWQVLHSMGLMLEKAINNAPEKSTPSFAAYNEALEKMKKAYGQALATSAVVKEREKDAHEALDILSRIVPSHTQNAHKAEAIAEAISTSGILQNDDFYSLKERIRTLQTQPRTNYNIAPDSMRHLLCTMKEEYSKMPGGFLRRFWC